MNCRKPRVSIGLPVYNGERFLEETLRSLLAQTYADFELIISDNASTDGTEEICRRYAATDKRVRYYRNTKNVGVGRNFNRVFELSSGDYFKWASADDLCKPEHLARCLDVLDNDETVVLTYPRARFIDESGRMLEINDPGWDLRSERPDERLRVAILAGHWINAHYGLIRAGALAETRLMPSYPGGDHRLIAELSLKGKFFEIPEYLFFRRIHPSASSQNTAKSSWTMEFHTGDRDQICFPLWNVNFDNLITIIKSDLTVRYKLSLIESVLRDMWWRHKRLLQELQIGLMFYRNRLIPRHYERTGNQLSETKGKTNAK
jgi:glycosyltransferase involved in cell wall biosynthesis